VKGVFLIMSSILNIIKTRRSVREFTDQEVSEDQLQTILEAARWAPSGLNNQPWRFVIIKDKICIETIGEFTKYTRIIAGANLIIVVLLDTRVMYDRIKDIQAIGACIQNMLLVIQELGLGACWIGEILNRKDEVIHYLELPDTFELMAVIAIGYPVDKKRVSTRKEINELVYSRR
jgi:nitroreductase